MSTLKWNQDRFGSEGGERDAFLRWLGKQDGRKCVADALKSGAPSPKTSSSSSSSSPTGKTRSDRHFAELTPDDAKKAVQTLIQAYTQGAKKGETTASKEILVNAVLKNLREGKYEPAGASIEAAANGKVVPGVEAGGASGGGKGESESGCVRIETHGLVAFDEKTGSCFIPRKALEESNALKSLALKAFKFVDLVKGTCADFEDFAKLEMKLRSSTLAVKSGRAKVDDLRPLGDSFKDEEDLLLLVEKKSQGEDPASAAQIEKLFAAALATSGEGETKALVLESIKTFSKLPSQSLGDAIGAVGGGLGAAAAGQPTYVKAIVDPWKKLVNDTLAVQLSMHKTERRREVIMAEIQENTVYLVQFDPSKKTKQREEFVARHLQLQEKQKQIEQEQIQYFDKHFRTNIQSWNLLLQSYYQHLVDKIYRKDGGLADLIEKLPGGAALTAGERESLESHWKTQFESVGKFINEHNKQVNKQKTLNEALVDLAKIREAFTVWIGADLIHWVKLIHPSHLAKGSGSSAEFTQVQIVEIDSDDSESEEDSGAEDEGGEGEAKEGASGSENGGNRTNLPSFVELGRLLKASEEIAKAKEADLRKVVAGYDRMRLRIHQLAVANIVDALYFGGLGDLYYEFQTNQVMRDLLKEGEKQSAKERKKKEREMAREEAVKSQGHQPLRKAKDDGGEPAGRRGREATSEEVVIDEAFAGYSLFSVLGEKTNQSRTRPAAGQPKGRQTKDKKAAPGPGNEVSKRFFRGGDGMDEGAPVGSDPGQGTKREKQQRRKKKRTRDIKKEMNGGDLGSNGRLAAGDSPSENGHLGAEEEANLKSVLAKRQAHLLFSVKLAKAELEAAQEKFEMAQSQLQRFQSLQIK